jgi:hypothetical protein
MILIHETGEGIIDANSYLNDFDVSFYMPSILLNTWQEFDNDVRVDYLVTASGFVDRSFRWIGEKTHEDQGLSWPRKGFLRGEIPYPDNKIPSEIKKACILALQYLINGGGIDVFDSSGTAAVKREKLAVMETEYFSASKVFSGNETDYADINNLLRGFYVNSSSNSNVITAKVLTA